MFEKVKPYLTSKLVLGGVLVVALLSLLLVPRLFIPSKPDEPTPPLLDAAPTSSPTATESDVVSTDIHIKTLEILMFEPSDLIDVDKSATFDTISVFLDGQPVPINARPFSYETRVYLPLRQVGEALNVKVGWNVEHSTAIVETPTVRLELPVGYRKANRIYKNDPENGELLSIDLTSTKVGTILYNDTTYLPIRFTAEALGFNVKFDDGNSTVLFTSPQ